MSLHPQSPSPGPADGRNASSNRQSLGPSPSARASLTPGSPRIGARPTSELLGSASMYQTPESEALDAWFENLQSYEKTLEEMAQASLDVNFKEELSAIEQWFKVLSEAERTAALYSLLQHSSQVQIRFFITVLQQMARSDPMTAMLSPAIGGSMQAQMDQKLATLKSPGLKSTFPASPTGRNFAGNRASLTLDSTSSFLSPESANNLAAAAAAGNHDAAHTLAQQRAKLKATNAAHRISAPVLSATSAERGAWGPGSASLGQVAEQNPSGAPAASPEHTRPKSTDFASAAAAANENPNNEATLPARDSWASMVNTPLIPMFQKQNTQGLEGATNKLNDWKQQQGGGGAPPAPGVPRMGDPTIHRRSNNGKSDNDKPGFNNNNNNMNNRNAGAGPGGGWNNNNGGGARSPPQGNNSRFGGDDNHNNNNPMAPMNGLGMQMAGFNPMASPNMGMGGPGLNQQIPPQMFNLQNLQVLQAMGMGGMAGMPPETQMLAAQMAAAGGFGQPGAPFFGMQPNSAGLGSPGNGPNRRPPKSAGLRSTASVSSAPKGEDDVDPAMLHDIPNWLRTLRLHKYTPNFEGMKWQDMVIMDDAALEAKGVAALGARRKMLKTFEVVRQKMGLEGAAA